MCRYNNQWIVVDYKQFVPGVTLKPNTVWIAEQIPGFIERCLCCSPGLSPPRLTPPQLGPHQRSVSRLLAFVQRAPCARGVTGGGADV
jgi:hypothetical protein